MSADAPSPLVFRVRWALNNLRSRPGRTILTIAGVGLAVALLIGVAGFHAGYRGALERAIAQLGFEVLVTAKGCPYETTTLFLRGGNIPMYLDEATRDAVIADPSVREATQLLMQATSSGDGRHQVYVGVDEKYRDMKPWLSLQMGEWFARGARNVAVLGYNAATELDKSPGDTLTVPGHNGTLEVVGILDRSGAQDDGTVFLPLRAAQKLFDKKDRLTGLGVRLKNPGDIPDFLRRMYSLPGVQAITMSQAQATILTFVGSARQLLMAVGALTAAIAALALAGSVLLSLMERGRELSILRALGARSGFLFWSVLLEASLICLLGAAFGLALAYAGGSLIESSLRRMVPFSPEGALLQIDLRVILASLALTLVAGVLCCIYPAGRAASTRPLKDIRHSE